MGDIEKTGREFFRQTTETDLREMRQEVTNVIMRSDTVLASAKEMIMADEDAHQRQAASIETRLSELHQVLHDVEEQNSISLAQTAVTFTNIQGSIHKQERFQESLLSELKQETLDTRDWCSTNLA